MAEVGGGRTRGSKGCRAGAVYARAKSQQIIPASNAGNIQHTSNHYHGYKGFTYKNDSTGCLALIQSTLSYHAATL